MRNPFHLRGPMVWDPRGEQDSEVESRLCSSWWLLSRWEVGGTPHIQSGKEGLASQDAQKRGHLTWAWDHVVEKRLDWRSRRGVWRAGQCRACWQQESRSLQPSPPPLFKATITLPTWPGQTKATGNTTAVSKTQAWVLESRSNSCAGGSREREGSPAEPKSKTWPDRLTKASCGLQQEGWPGGSLPGSSGATVGKSPDSHPLAPSLPPQHPLQRTSLPSVTPLQSAALLLGLSHCHPLLGCEGGLAVVPLFTTSSSSESEPGTRPGLCSSVFREAGMSWARLWWGRGCATASPSLKRSHRHRLALWRCQHRAWWASWPSTPHHPELAFLPLALGYVVQHPSTWTGQEEVSQL